MAVRIANACTAVSLGLKNPAKFWGVIISLGWSSSVETKPSASN